MQVTCYHFKTLYIFIAHFIIQLSSNRDLEIINIYILLRKHLICKYHNHSTSLSPNEVHGKTQISSKALSWHENRSTWSIDTVHFKLSGWQRYVILQKTLSTDFKSKIENVTFVYLCWARLVRGNSISGFDASNLIIDNLVWFYGACSTLNSVEVFMCWAYVYV